MDGDLGGGFWVVPVDLVAAGPIVGVRGALALFAGRVHLRPWFLAQTADMARVWQVVAWGHWVNPCSMFAAGASGMVLAMATMGWMSSSSSDSVHLNVGCCAV